MGTMLRFRNAIRGSRGLSLISREHGPSGQPADQRVLRAVRFMDHESYLQAIPLLEELGRDESLEFELAVDNIAVLPQWSYDRLVPRLRDEQVRFADIKVASFRELSPEKQAEARDLIFRQD